MLNLLACPDVYFDIVALRSGSDLGVRTNGSYDTPECKFLDFDLGHLEQIALVTVRHGECVSGTHRQSIEKATPSSKWKANSQRILSQNGHDSTVSSPTKTGDQRSPTNKSSA